MSPDFTLPTPSSYLANEPFAAYTVSSLPVTGSILWLIGVVVLGIAVLLSLAIAYHWVNYSKHALLGIFALGVYVVGFFFFAGLVVASGIF